MSLSIEALLKRSIQSLTLEGSDSPQVDAAVLLCHVLDKPRSYLLTWPEKIVSDEELGNFNALLERRLAGEPIAYIVGYREFWSLPLKVSPTTLIPRPDTERLVEVALDHLTPNAQSILDLGTGTGAIALAIASEMPTLNVIGVDYQDDAVELAKENAKINHINNVEFRQGSWFEPISLSDKFEIIVSNPPYIDGNDPHLSEGDVRFEPQTALVAEQEGFADLLHIIDHSRQHLIDNGWLLMEHGFEQGNQLRDYFIEYGFINVKTEQDYTGNDRVTLGQWVVDN
ncbi:peptide chain release factor N(5)-glutamine methyltransferase [Aliivibrio fischeri]|uniref:Release factor glutamine methyltransferase n=1 Tax=Aliivibrio fischeri TaxID=668 RepID=A0A6N3Z7F7_ALIFS|nr:peptide chain release factor N(5)-glutamine methyltransferase [Aliivibrio fischeri]MUK45885.1 peptide chain release factor N(5)-glutamine methyltransferase [Aliivibrio fischeri]MUK79572.1 peptide chain release factor N(5)-glutamine methyltransferase [Aliivibrio fischeri]MUK83464.1 peptide chain release factor N(5)-glutamine methyltransferase [Aliivibrio fischeri]